MIKRPEILIPILDTSLPSCFTHGWASLPEDHTDFTDCCHQLVFFLMYGILSYFCIWLLFVIWFIMRHERYIIMFSTNFIDSFVLLWVHGILNNLCQHHILKASVRYLSIVGTMDDQGFTMKWKDRKYNELHYFCVVIYPSALPICWSIR